MALNDENMVMPVSPMYGGGNGAFGGMDGNGWWSSCWQAVAALVATAETASVAVSLWITAHPCSAASISPL